MLVEERFEIGEFTAVKVSKKARVNKRSNAKDVVELPALRFTFKKASVWKAPVNPPGKLFQLLFKSLVMASINDYTLRGPHASIPGR